MQVARTYRHRVRKTQHSEQDSDNDVIEVHRFVTRPAMVKVAIGGTFSMDNFESVRYDVSFEVPCYREEMEETYDFALGLANERFQTEVDDTRDFVMRSRSQAKHPF